MGMRVRAVYRVSQAWHLLTARVQPEEQPFLDALLPPAGRALFVTMSAGDQRHCLNVCYALQEQSCQDADLLAAALLHDVGKGGGRVRFWMRPVIGADLAAMAGLSEQTVIFIRTHHDPHGPAAALHAVDDQY